MKKLAFLCLVLAAGPAAGEAPAAGGPPATAVEPVTETLHGVEIADPYRWLEGSAAPELSAPDPELDARVAAWTDAQNAYTRGVLDRLPGRKRLEARLRELLGGDFTDIPVARRNRYFHEIYRGGSNQGALVMREGLDGKPRTLIDPNAIDPSGSTTLAWFEPDPDGTLVAFGLFSGGDERTVLHVLDVATGLWLPEEIPGRVREVCWLPDSSGFFYNGLADPEDPYSRQVAFHRLGTHHRHDRVLFEQYDEGPFAETWGPFGHASRDGRWLILGYWKATGANDLWVADLDRWLATGELVKEEILTGETAQIGLPDVYAPGDPIVGDTLYTATSLGAPNKRVVAIDLNHPQRRRWREIVPERDDAVLVRITAGRGVLAAEYLAGAASRIELFDLDGGSLGELPLPGIGTAGVQAAPDRTEAFLYFTSFNEPPSLYRVDLATGDRELWRRIEVPVDPSRFEVRQVRFPSGDGTPISMFVVHRKGLALDGSNPTLLEGYGGFSVSMTPYFNFILIPWLEAGGVYALPNLRGGGEYGEEWHRAGMLERKQNVFDDFAAAARWLIAEGYTSPRRLGISGGSNGGLLTGASLVQHPELFSAVVAEVPILDMVRYHRFLRARNWVPELGSSEDPEQLGFLLAYSPYHNVRDTTAYPAVLLTAAENDERVHALHARKMAARLQGATASDPAAEPVLLWVERETGHGAGKPMDLWLRETVDRLSFLAWQLGLDLTG